MRVLIIGCGYVGLPLGTELARMGHEVHGICRSAERLAGINQASITPVVADFTQPGGLDRLELPFDWVVNTLSSSKGGVEEYRAIYLEGTRRILEWLSIKPPAKYVYTSSTSVYAQQDGSWVTEESAAEPRSETSRILVETERLLAEAAQRRNFPAVVLRVAGIYGPARGHLFQQYLRGEAHLDGEGSRLINMIHRDDVVRAIIAALERGKPGQVYNVTDDEPITQREFFAWLSAQLCRPMPSPADETAGPVRKRTVTNKRVSNRKLRLELGCELGYPTFRQGYLAEIAGLQAAGQLPVGAGQ